jgi:copper(I)-binding protein
MISRALLPVFVLLVPPGVAAAEPQSIQADDLTITPAWMHATADGVTSGAVYFTIQNGGKQLETLLRASSPVAGEAIFHRTNQQDGVAHMEQLWTIDVVAGRTVQFEPGARHVMLGQLKQPLKAGTSIPVTLQFQHAGAITLQVQIVPVGATKPAASGS